MFDGILCSIQEISLVNFASKIPNLAKFANPYQIFERAPYLLAQRDIDFLAQNHKYR